VTVGAACYARTMRYPDGRELTAAERARRELAALVKVGLKMQYRPGLNDGFPARTGLGLALGCMKFFMQ